MLPIRLAILVFATETLISQEKQCFAGKTLLLLNDSIWGAKTLIEKDIAVASSLIRLAIIFFCKQKPDLAGKLVFSRNSLSLLNGYDLLKYADRKNIILELLPVRLAIVVLLWMGMHTDAPFLSPLGCSL